MDESELAKFREYFISRLNAARENHVAALGLKCSFIEPGRAGMYMDWQEELAVSGTSGIVAGGAMTALLDSCCALAAATSGEEIAFSPTLDLRMDHMGLPDPRKRLNAEAEAYRVTSSVIFTSGIIFHDDPERPIVRGLFNFTPISQRVADTGTAPSGEGQS
ncbi:PaaI family thioesterase [Gilvimarinus sp. F26214L]|uniref:PaaI family thioesterase n=1 Tax=Gilvimarinus sp. DZF01 TaxID=3461371 RepID=UPI0040458E47